MVCYGIDFTIPLFLEKFLSWNFEDDPSARTGFWILGAILGSLALRLILEYQGAFIFRRVRILTSNALEVRLFLIFILSLLRMNLF